MITPEQLKAELLEVTNTTPQFMAAYAKIRSADILSDAIRELSSNLHSASYEFRQGMEAIANNLYQVRSS